MQIYVASDDAAVAFQLRDSLAQLGRDCPPSHVLSLDAAPARLAPPSSGGADPDIVFVILSGDPDGAAYVIRELRRKGRGRLVAVGPATDPKLLLRMIREGAHEYLDQSNLAGELGPALERLTADGGASRVGRITAVVGASGGCGCTTLAVGIAVAHAKASRACVLVDLCDAGDAATLLDLKPTYSLADVAASGSRLDRGLFESTLAAHASGVKLLAAPAQIGAASRVATDDVRRVLSLSAEVAPFVVADVGRGFHAAAAQALGQADDVLLVMRLDFTSLRNARRLLERFADLGQDPARLRLVVNRYKQPGELPVAEAEAALEMKVARFVVDDPKTVNRANNNGVPVLIHAASSKVSSQITDLAGFLRAAPRP